MQAPADATPFPTQKLDLRASFWLVAALTLASVLLLGYEFGKGNHAEQLPPVLRALDPNYLQNDWTVNANQGFNHRWFYTTSMALASRALGVPGAFFALYLTSLLAWAIGVSALVCSLWPDQKSTPIALFFAPLLLLFSTWGTLSNTLVFPNLIPALPALALAVWFGVMLRRGHFIIAAVLLLAAGLIHAQIGPFSGAFVLFAQGYALSDNASERRRLLRHLPLWILGIALPLGLALVSDDKRVLSAAQSREALDVLTYLRHPHHYIPINWSFDAWLGEIAWLALTWAARYIAKPSRFLDGLLLATLIFCASGALPFLIESLFPLVKLQQFRMTIWLQIAGSIYLAKIAADYLRDEATPRRIGGALLFAALLMPLVSNSPGAYRLVLPGCLLAFHFASRRANWSSLLWLLPWIPFWVTGRADATQFGLKIVATAMFALASLALLKLEQHQPQRALRLNQSAALLAALALFGLFLRPPTGRLARFNRVQTRLDIASADGAMEAWVRANTPRDAVFLVPLTLESFRLKANRAVVVDFKVFPWSDAGLLDWRGRIDAVLGAPLPLGDYKPAILEAKYRDLSAVQVEHLARSFGASYFVTTARATGDFQGFERVYGDGKWQIFRVSAALKSTSKG